MACDQTPVFAHSRSFQMALLISGSIVLLSGCNGGNAGNPQNVRLTFLTLNLRGVMDEPCNDASRNWKVRYANVGSDLKAGGVVPDVIALQEVNGWTWCTFNHRMIPDYAPLEELVTALESGTGVKYRIAYLNALTKVGGNFHCTVEGTSLNACEAVSGLALLYNRARLRNLLADTSVEDAASAYSHDAPHQEGAHLRRSLPNCSPASGSLIESQIDGPTQTDKCNRDTPGGLAWITGTEGALARLEFVDRPGAPLHVYNVHLAWQSDRHPGHVTAVNAAVRALEARFGASRWIPPLIMGDFNNWTDEATLADFPRFDHRGNADTGNPDGAINDWILSGKAEAFPASSSITGHITTVMPRVPAAEGGCLGKWSDHCGVLTTLTIQ